MLHSTKFPENGAMFRGYPPQKVESSARESLNLMTATRSVAGAGEDDKTKTKSEIEIVTLQSMKLKTPAQAQAHLKRTDSAPAVAVGFGEKLLQRGNCNTILVPAPRKSLWKACFGCG